VQQTYGETACTKARNLYRDRPDSIRQLIHTEISPGAPPSTRTNSGSFQSLIDAIIMFDDDIKHQFLWQPNRDSDIASRSIDNKMTDWKDESVPHRLPAQANDDEPSFQISSTSPPSASHHILASQTSPLSRASVLSTNLENGPNRSELKVTSEEKLSSISTMRLRPRRKQALPISDLEASHSLVDNSNEEEQNSETISTISTPPRISNFQVNKKRKRKQSGITTSENSIDEKHENISEKKNEVINSDEKKAQKKRKVVAEAKCTNSIQECRNVKDVGPNCPYWAHHGSLTWVAIRENHKVALMFSELSLEAPTVVYYRELKKDLNVLPAAIMEHIHQNCWILTKKQRTPDWFVLRTFSLSSTSAGCIDVPLEKKPSFAMKQWFIETKKTAAMEKGIRNEPVIMEQIPAFLEKKFSESKQQVKVDKLLKPSEIGLLARKDADYIVASLDGIMIDFTGEIACVEVKTIVSQKELKEFSERAGSKDYVECTFTEAKKYIHDKAHWLQLQHHCMVLNCRVGYYVTASIGKILRVLRVKFNDQEIHNFAISMKAEYRYLDDPKVLEDTEIVDSATFNYHLQLHVALKNKVLAHGPVSIKFFKSHLQRMWNISKGGVDIVSRQISSSWPRIGKLPVDSAVVIRSLYYLLINCSLVYGAKKVDLRSLNSIKEYREKIRTLPLRDFIYVVSEQYLHKGAIATGANLINADHKIYHSISSNATIEIENASEDQTEVSEVVNTKRSQSKLKKYNTPAARDRRLSPTGHWVGESQKSMWCVYCSSSNGKKRIGRRTKFYCKKCHAFLCLRLSTNQTKNCFEKFHKTDTLKHKKL